MKNIVAQVNKPNIERVNPLLFDRNANMKIHEYIVDGYKSLEVLSYIKFTGWKLITDESKINIKLNRRHLKDRVVQKDKSIDKLKSINKTAVEMLVANFVIEYEGDTRYIEKSLLIPAYIDKYHLMIDGNEILPIWQIVDMSTYTQGKSVKLKTSLTPIDVYREVYKKKSFITTDGLEFKFKTFVLNLFTKELNPLIYFVAQLGVPNVINYFSMKGIVDVCEEEYDKEINHYFKINKKLFIEVDKRYFEESDFVKQFSFMLFELFGQRANMMDLDNIDYWLTKLGAVFTTNTKNQLNKGSLVITSFDRVLDDTTKRTSKLDNLHLQSTNTIIRHMLQNFKELKKKDNHNMEYKRLRCNEALAHYFVRSMSSRVNSLLSKRKLVIDSIEKIFNFNEDELFKLLIFSKKPCILLRYNCDINDFQALNALRVTSTGIQGLPSGRNVSSEHRDIYASQIGRFDLNGISHGPNTGLSTILCPTCFVDKNGFFTKECKDPDTFNSSMKALKKNLADEVIDARKKVIHCLKIDSDILIRRRKYMANIATETGQYVISKRFILLKDGNRVIVSSRNRDTDKLRVCVNVDGMKMTEDGRHMISRRYNLNMMEDGRVRILKRISILDTDLFGRNVISDRKANKRITIRGGQFVIAARKIK